MHDQVTEGMRHTLSVMAPERVYTTGEIMAKAGLKSGKCTRQMLSRMLRAGLIDRMYHSIGGNTHSRWMRND